MLIHIADSNAAREAKVTRVLAGPVQDLHDVLRKRIRQSTIKHHLLNKIHIQSLCSEFLHATNDGCTFQDAGLTKSTLIVCGPLHRKFFIALAIVWFLMQFVVSATSELPLAIVVVEFLCTLLKVKILLKLYFEFNIV